MDEPVRRRTGPGRQAEAARNDTAVLTAARLVFAVNGPDAPVSLIAQAAGVGIGTLYRRFSSKGALLQHLCRASLAEQLELADATSRGAATPWSVLAEFIEASVEIRAGALTTLAGRFEPDQETVSAARAVHARVARMVRAAQRDGSLRPDVRAGDVHELVALFSRRPAEDRNSHRRLLALAVAGLRSRESPLPGSPVAWEPYESRWTSR